MLVRRVIAGVLLVLGAIWFLQGIDLLGGSFMSGNGIWAVFGTILILVAIALARGPRASRDT